MKVLTEEELDVLADLERLQAVAAYDLGNPALVRELSVIAAGTANLLQQPIATTNVLLDTAAVVQGSYGLEGHEDAIHVPAEWSLCVPVLRSGTPRIVRDLAQDPREQENPLLLQESARCYASVPLSTPSGQIVGTHCVCGWEPHDFTAAELEVLASGAAQSMNTLERHLRD